MDQLRQNANNLSDIVDVIWCTIRYGASPNNYNEFEFKQLNRYERDTYVTNRLSKKIIRKYNNSNYIDCFEDKTKFAKYFADYFGRSWISTEKLDYKSFLEFINGKNKFIYKPVENAQGNGIIVYDDLTKPDIVFKSITQLGNKAILEEWIQQDDRFNQIYDKAVNCLRIITIYKDGITNFITGG
jgi:hypothetical protein